nr:hypothetical protein [Salinivirgaceae bacterium]
MKRIMNLGLAFIFCILILAGCDEDDVSLNESNNVDFLALYKPGSEQILGADKLVAKMSLNKGELTFAPFLDVYPGSSMTADCSINNKKLAMGLEWRAFDNQGIYMDMGDLKYENLPLATPRSDSYYAFFNGGTQNVSDNGYVIYISGTNNIYYGDEGKRILMRYNSATHDSISIPSPVAFALSQPEKGGDTETCQYNTNIFGSTDGRYAYGHLEAFGLQGNMYHWDYEILFQYDFENEEFTRLGEAEDDDAHIYAMTADRKYLIYSNRGVMKMLNIETNQVSLPDPDMNLINVNRNNWNNYGACVGTTNGYVVYKDFVSNKEIDVCDVSVRVKNTMFSKSGDRIYFVIDSDEKYLCLTEGLTENSPYDT